MGRERKKQGACCEEQGTHLLAHFPQLYHPLDHSLETCPACHNSICYPAHIPGYAVARSTVLGYYHYCSQPLFTFSNELLNPVGDEGCYLLQALT